MYDLQSTGSLARFQISKYLQDFLACVREYKVVDDPLIAWADCYYYRVLLLAVSNRRKQ